MRILGLTRLRPASTVEDRKDFASTFNASLDALGVAPGDEFVLAHPAALAERAPKVGRCVYCDGPVSSSDYQRTTGWARNRGAEGGTNAIRVRETAEEWACASCVDKEAKGIGAAQQALA